MHETKNHKTISPFPGTSREDPENRKKHVEIEGITFYNGTSFQNEKKMEMHPLLFGHHY